MALTPSLLAILGCGVPTDPDPVDGPPAAVAAVPTHARVGVPVTLDASGSSGSDARWILPTGSVDGFVVTHTFEAPGHLSLFLEVEGEDGRVDTVDVPLTVTWSPLPTPPASSDPLAASTDRLWAVLPDHDRLVEVDPVERRVVAHHPTCVGPRAVAVAAGSPAVACPGSDTVTLHAADGSIAAALSLPWGSGPAAIVPWGEGLAVALQGRGEITAIGIDPPAIGAVLGALPDPRGLASDGTVLIASRLRSPDHEGQALAIRSAGTVPWSLPVDLGPDSDTNARGVPTYLQRVAVRPDGRVAVVGGLKANTERGIYLEDQPLTFDTTTRADLRVVALDPDEGPRDTPIATAVFDDRDLVSALAFSPLGDWLFVAHLGMETVDVLDAYTLARSGAAGGMGHGPDGLWVSPDGATLWVLASLSRALVAYDLTGGVATPIEVARLDLLPPTGEAVDPEVLQGQIVFHRSADPRMSEQGYLSCASCHLDGGDDGRTWDFTQRGEGLRNTLSLAGRSGDAHGPIHWSGNFDEVQDFENDIRGAQGGRGFLSEADWSETSDPLGPTKAGRSEDLDALARYLETFDTVPRSPHRAPDGSLTPEAVVGQGVFEDPAVGCATCHVPPTYTDSVFVSPGEPLLHDVGTLGPGSGDRLGEPLVGLDTPTLRGLHATAPYLHDGSAPDLLTVIVDANPDDAHGVTSVLSAEQREALIAFLLQIE